MTDTLYNKQDLTRLHYGFSVKHMVFMALKNFFLTTLWISFVLFSILILFVAQWLCVPNQRSSWVLESIEERRHFFLLLSNVCFDFEYIPVSCRLMSVTVLSSTHGFLNLVLRVFLFW